jgi:uncharacterized membrane protein YdjX (TVP38/TMEM64 family)
MEIRRPVPWLRWALLSAYLLVLLSLSLAARDSAWSDELTPQKLSQRGQTLLALPLGPLAVLASYVVLVLMAVPVFVLIAVAATLFGPWLGMAYSLAGMVMGATVAFALGQFAGADGMDRLMHGRLALLSQQLSRRGLLAVAMVRFMPVAPFMVINLAAGALRVSVRDFVLGTVLGLLPGTVLLSLFTERLVAAWQSSIRPSWQVLLVPGATVLVVMTLRWVRRKRAKGHAHKKAHRQ